MADFDAQIRESQEQVATAQGKIAELTSRIEAARVYGSAFIGHITKLRDKGAGV